MYEYHETNDRAGRAAESAGSGATRLADLRKQLESLGRFVFGCAVVATAVLTYLVVQSIVTSSDLAMLGRNGGMINAKLDALTPRLTGIDEAMEELAALRAAAERRPAAENWTGVFISDLGPLLPYLAQGEAETGEVWIYSESEAFLARIGEALQSLEDAGMDVQIERSE